MVNDEKFLRGLLLSAGVLAGVVLLGAAWLAHASLTVSLALAGGILLGAVALAGLEVACRRIAVQSEGAAARIAALESEVADLKAQYQEEAAESARGSVAHDAAEAGRQQLESALRDSARTAAEARTLTTETEESVQQASRGVHAMGDAIDALNQSSSQISAILETINKIAFQTNILALNAAVEATRAGEAGAGFTVVASEVRRLAQESTTAAKQTAEHVDSAVSWIMQCEMLKTEAVSALNGVSDKVKQLQTTADNLSQSLSSASTAAAQPSEPQPAS